MRGRGGAGRGGTRIPWLHIELEGISRLYYKLHDAQGGMPVWEWRVVLWLGLLLIRINRSGFDTVLALPMFG